MKNINLGLFGERVSRVRQALALNRRQFAEKIGFSSAHVGRIEKGEGAPSEVFARSICNAYQINLDFLLTGAEPMFTPVGDVIKNLVGPKYQMLSDLGFLAREANLDEIPEELLAIVHNLLRIHRHQWATIEKIVEAFCNQVGIEYERPGREQKKEAPELEMKEKAG